MNEQEGEHPPMMGHAEPRGDAAQPDEQASENRGVPGEGAGRRDEVGHTGVYPVSASEGASGDAPLIAENQWGQGERGAAGYDDSGDSELFERGPSTPSEQ